jgi:hypothetical protein
LNEPTERRKKTQISLSLTLSFEEDEEKKETRKRTEEVASSPSRACAHVFLSLVFDIERERTMYMMRGKKRIKFPPKGTREKKKSLSVILKKKKKNI